MIMKQSTNYLHSQKNASYEAESGCNDDLVMCLVLFGWLTEQKFFKDLTDINTLLKLKEKSFEDLNDDMLPFGFIDDGNQSVSDDMSCRDDYWIVVDQN